MFDKRIVELAPGAFRLVIASVCLRWVALVGRVCALVCAACILASLFGGSSSVTPLAQFHRSTVLLLALLGCLVFAACTVGAQHLSSRAAAQAKLRVRMDLYRKLFELGEVGGTPISNAEATQMLGEGIERLDAYMGRYVPQLFYAVCAPLTLFFVILPMSAPAAITLLVCVPLIPVSIAFFMKAAKRVMGEYWDSYVDLAEEFLDAVSGLTTLISFRADEAAHARLNERAEKVRLSTMRLLRVQLNSVTLMDFFAYGGAAAGICVALVQLSAGALALWQFIAIAFLALEFFMPMRTLGSYFHTGMGAAAVIDRAFQVLNAPVPQTGTQALPQGELDIACSNLGFSYGKGAFALRNVTFEVPSGSYVGICGLSGSGKSTLVAALAGRLRSYEGSLTLGGVEVRDLDPDALHRALCVIGARSHVFRGSIRSNLLLGREDATDAQMWEVLNRCKLQREVLELGGLDAEVAEGGANLSGGQRQRLCIARALLRDAEIYVFDEATSAVDAQSEADILALIQQLALTKTIIVVSHRLSALRWTDEVLVMDAGRVAQRGEHAFLIHQNGLYAELWAKQAELEQFAQAASAGSLRADQKVLSGPAISAGEARALEQMPDSLAAIMRMAIENKPVREAIAGAPQKSAHPAWIPRGPGDVRPISDGSQESPTIDEATGTGDEVQSAAAEAEQAPSGGSRSSLSIIAGLLKVTRAQVPVLIRALFFGVCALLVAVAMPAIALSCALGVADNAQGIPLVVGCVAVIACGACRGPLRYAERLGTHDQAFRTLALVRDRVFGAMRKLAPAKLQGRDAGDLVSLLTSDVELLEGFYARTVAPLAVTLVGTIICLVVMTFLSSAAALMCALAACVVGIAVPCVANRMVAQDGRLIHERAVFMTSTMLDNLAGMAELVQFEGAAKQAKQLEDHMSKALADEGGFGRKAACASSLGPVLALVALVVLSWFTGCVDGSVHAGAVIALVMFGALTEPLVGVAQLGASLHQVLAAGGRILDLLEEEPETPEITQAKGLSEFTGACLSGVDFAYADGTQALLGASLACDAGSICALSGRSGAGKSTALKLLMRFWDPDSGTVSISGRDVRAINTCDLRALVGYAEQETYLFAGTLRSNISMARPKATQAELEYALTRACLGDLVERLPQGLDTPLGEGGVRVSDGERQRIGLARLFLYGAPFNLLDEPTSNLDVMHEAAVLRSLHERKDGRAYLMVSHRPSVTSIADVVYRMGGE